LRRIRWPVAVVGTACALAAVPAPAGAVGPSTAVVRKINEFRKAHGRRPLRVSGSLRRSARAYSRTMMRRDYFGHASRISASRRLFRRVGEALEFHSGDHARASLAVKRWKRSPSHRRLLLSPSFHWIGAGRAAGGFRGRSATIWVVQLGAR
jgi:uncharacterized protein YkwD